MPAIAKVEPLVTARSLRGPFDYRLPREMSGVEVGTVLVVPFGRRRMLGVVVEVASESDLPPERLVEPISALEQGVPNELAGLGLWLAEEYCSTPARGLALVLPPGTGTSRQAAPAARTREALVAEIAHAGREAIARDSDVRLSEGQRRVLDVLARGEAPSGGAESAPAETLAAGRASAAELAKLPGVDHGSLRRLAARRLISLTLRPVRRRVDALELGERDSRGEPAVPPGRPDLTAPQRDALGRITDALRAGRYERLLLHGVTGSGKTEVYLGAAAESIEQGRSAIVLVPEIALTPQTARRFRERFGERVAVLHSRLGLGERYDEWRRLRDGDARVCVGPRSAVFAPLPALGLIVIDEEHDPAYKQEGDPRYDARRVAERRAEAAGAVLVSGSATPRPESWLRMERIELPERVDGLPLPPVELLDMRESRHALHRAAREALDEVKRRRAKAIVLVNRRGWSPFLVCRSCGETWMCPRCEVTLTLHRDRAANLLLCHHCGHRERSPSKCSACLSTAVSRHGTGTQRIEAELREALYPLPVFRLDGDAAQRKHGIASVLRGFDEASAGILVGTQMVAQGHDFPEVELAVVQDADATLRFPDFRAEERTFSLVAQLAGRSGRGPRGGRVLVQTLCPEASCLRHAARHDASTFLAEELERRRALDYPPFSNLIRLTAQAPSQKLADEAMRSVRSALDLHGAQVLGPAPLFRVKERFRSTLLIKDRERGSAVRAVGEAVGRTSPELSSADVAISVDVDPQ